MGPAADPKGGGITLLQLLAAVAAVLAATAALTSHPGAQKLHRAMPRPRARVMAGGNATVGWRDVDEEDRLGDESPEDERMFSLLDTGLRGYASNMGWLPADERHGPAPPASCSVYLTTITRVMLICDSCWFAELAVYPAAIGHRPRCYARILGAISCITRYRASVERPRAPAFREEERGRVAPEALMSVYLRLPSYEKRPVIKAIVFYGRRYSVRLLNCYLERNLLRGGGLLSEVAASGRKDSSRTLPAAHWVFCCARGRIHFHMRHFAFLFAQYAALAAGLRCACTSGSTCMQEWSLAGALRGQHVGRVRPGIPDGLDGAQR
jgi:hypothetical protein